MAHDEGKSGTGNNGRSKPQTPGGLGGILGGLAELLNSVGELAEKGEQLKRAGDFETSSGKRGSVQVGFNVRTAGTGSSDGSAKYTVEPFGDVRRDESTGQPVVNDVREPAVDVFTEDDHVLIVAEMPGVSEQDLEIRVEGDSLHLSGEGRGKRYAKRVSLPGDTTGEPAVSSNNGVFEIRLDRAA